MPAPDKATERLLVIFETIAQQGPLSLVALTEATGLPRSAVHRGAQVLQARGWISARLSDHAYAVSSRFDDAVANARYTHEEAEALSPLMTDLSQAFGCHVDIGLFVARGVFEVVDSTNKRADLGRRSLIASEIALAAQVSLSPAGRVRHLEAFLAHATREDTEFVTSGGHFRRLKAAEAIIEQGGAMRSPDDAGLVPFVAPSGVAGALRIYPRKSGEVGQAMALAREKLDATGYPTRLTET